MDYKLENITTMIKIATILHNLCIISGDDIEIDWEIPQLIHKKPASNVQTIGGGDISDTLTDLFLQNLL